MCFIDKIFAQYNLSFYLLQLMEILGDKANENIITWLPHGKAFIVYQKEKFANDILPRYFKETKYTSFTRKLNRWGFERVNRGPEVGAYYHKFFQRSNPHCCMKMSCVSSKMDQDTTTYEKAPSPPPLYDTPTTTGYIYPQEPQTPQPSNSSIERGLTGYGMPYPQGSHTSESLMQQLWLLHQQRNALATSMSMGEVPTFVQQQPQLVDNRFFSHFPQMQMMHHNVGGVSANASMENYSNAVLGVAIQTLTQSSAVNNNGFALPSGTNTGSHYRIPALLPANKTGLLVNIAPIQLPRCVIVFSPHS